MHKSVVAYYAISILPLTRHLKSTCILYTLHIISQITVFTTYIGKITRVFHNHNVHHALID